MRSIIRAFVFGGLAIGSTSLCSYGVDVNGAPADKPAAPATQPIDPKVQELIAKLADDDPAARDAASKQLEAMGRTALPALKEEANSENPEQRARIRSLIRRAERRLPPAAPPRQGIGFTHSVRMSVNNGQRTVEVDDNGYKIRIRQDQVGIQLDVTGVEDGKEVTETYKAKDADQLKKDNPEAYALYDKYNNGGGGMIIGGVGANGGVQGNVRIQINGGGVGGQLRIGGNGNGQPPAPKIIKDPEEIIKEMRKRMQEHLEKPGVPEEHRQRVQEMLERVQKQQQDIHDQLLKQLEEEKRKAIDDLKVPDREDIEKVKPDLKKEKEELKKEDLKKDEEKKDAK